MICLTADVHHPMGTAEQNSLPGRELDAATEYVDILRSYDLSATLFVTGKCFEYETTGEITDRTDVEIGGHTWNALRPPLLHSVFGKLFESQYGPRLYQKWDIRRTIRTIESNVGTPVRSWRTHSYASSESTYALLADNGIRVASEYTAPSELTPRRDSGGVWHLPVNVPPDHSHIVHGNVTPEEHERIGWDGTDFGTELYDSDEWLRRIEEGVREADDSDVVTILAHPGCQQLIDDFETFERLCSVLSDHRTETVSKAASAHAEQLSV